MIVRKIMVYLPAILTMAVSFALSAGEQTISEYYLRVGRCSTSKCVAHITKKLKRITARQAQLTDVAAVPCLNSVLLGPFQQPLEAEQRQNWLMRWGWRVDVVREPVSQGTQQETTLASENTAADRQARIETQCSMMVAAPRNLRATDADQNTAKTPNSKREPEISIAVRSQNNFEKRSTVARLKGQTSIAYQQKREELQPQWKRSRNNVSGSKMSWRVGIDTPLLIDSLQGIGIVSYGGFNSRDSAGFSERDRYFYKLGVKGAKDDFGYGVSYHSIGKRYARTSNMTGDLTRDTAGIEGFLSWQISDLKLKAKYSEFWNNLNRDPNKKSRLDKWFNLGTRYRLSTEPSMDIDLSYGIGERRSTILPAGADRYRGPLRSLESKFRFVDENLSFSVGSNIFKTRNILLDGPGEEKQKYFFNGVLFPDYWLSIYPAFSLSRIIKSGIAYEQVYKTTRSSVSLVFRPVEDKYRFTLHTALDNYAGYRNVVADRDTLKVGAKIDLKTHRNFFGHNAWSLEVQHKDRHNRIIPQASYSDWSVELVWRWLKI